MGSTVIELSLTEACAMSSTTIPVLIMKQAKLDRSLSGLVKKF